MSGKRDAGPKRKHMRYEVGSESDEDNTNSYAKNDLHTRKRTPSPTLGNLEVKETGVDYGDFILDRTEGIEMVNLEEGETLDDSFEASSSADQSSLWIRTTASSMLSPIEAKTVANVEQRKRYVPECFNCGGEHVLGKCTQPRDFRRIREAQDALRSRKREKERLENRYHVENGDSDQEKFRPGKISTALREALGIGPDDIPEWIYRMRRKGFVDGYPPGYLKKAVVKPDTALLKFHTIDATGEKNEHSDDEDTVPPTINKDAMITYMGFNSTYRHLRDRESTFRVPPFSMFCEFHENRLIENHAKMLGQRRDERKREKKKAKRRREDMEKDGNVAILEPPKPPSFDKDLDDCIIIDTEPPMDESISMDSSQSDSMLPPPTPGSSTSVIIGTPVSHRRKLDGSHDDAHPQPPALDAFSKGIVPFEAREEPTAHRGFMKKMLQKIKDILPGR